MKYQHLSYKVQHIKRNMGWGCCGRAIECNTTNETSTSLSKVQQVKRNRGWGCYSWAIECNKTVVLQHHSVHKCAEYMQTSAGFAESKLQHMVSKQSFRDTLVATVGSLLWAARCSLIKLSVLLGTIGVVMQALPLAYITANKYSFRDRRVPSQAIEMTLPWGPPSSRVQLLRYRAITSSIHLLDDLTFDFIAHVYV